MSLVFLLVTWELKKKKKVYLLYLDRNKYYSRGFILLYEKPLGSKRSANIHRLPGTPESLLLHLSLTKVVLFMILFFIVLGLPF